MLTIQCTLSCWGSFVHIWLVYAESLLGATADTRAGSMQDYGASLCVLCCSGLSVPPLSQGAVACWYPVSCCFTEDAVHGLLWLAD